MEFQVSHIIDFNNPNIFENILRANTPTKNL